MHEVQLPMGQEPGLIEATRASMRGINIFICKPSMASIDILCESTVSIRLSSPESLPAIQTRYDTRLRIIM